MNTSKRASLTQFLEALHAVPTGPRCVAVEGGVCAGKTTVVHEIASRGVGVLVEYTDLAEYRGAPDRWPNNAAQLTSRLDHFLELEAIRRSGVPNSTSWIVADRSILSLAAFEYGLRAARWPAFPDACLAYLTTAIEAAPQLAPALAVVVETPTAIRRTRAEAAKMAIRAPLLDPDFLAGERLFFDLLHALEPSLVAFVGQQQATATILSRLPHL